MNRPIKFMAWDKWEKKWWIPESLFKFARGLPSNWEKCFDLYQFTGLLDKEGKEIYEGSLIRIRFKCIHEDPVEYVDVDVFWNEDIAAWDMDSEDKYSDEFDDELYCLGGCFDFQQDQTIELIGHIAEEDSSAI